MVSGSYSPGCIYLFRGLGRGEYAGGERLRGLDGKLFQAGLASAVSVADCDQDGHPDLLIGNIHGQVWLLRNKSHDGQLAFGPMEGMVARTRPVSALVDAGPLVVDWDGDGIPDLLLGSGDGSVTFYRGVKTKGLLALEDGVELIPKAPTSGGPLLQGMDPKTGQILLPPLDRSSMRAKLATYDWNGDGKLDLLVGDVVSMVGPEPELTAEQKAKREDLDNQRKDLSHEISALFDRANTETRQELKVTRHVEDLELQEAIDSKNRERLSKNPKYSDLYSKLDAVEAELKPLRATYSTHGFVWVYLRTGDATAVGTRRDSR